MNTLDIQRSCIILILHETSKNGFGFPVIRQPNNSIPGVVPFTAVVCACHTARSLPTTQTTAVKETIARDIT